MHYIGNIDGDLSYAKYDFHLGVNEAWFHNSVLSTITAHINVVQTFTWVNQASFDNVLRNVSMYLLSQNTKPQIQ